MKTCENCNSEITDNQVYCNNCGHKNNPSLLDTHVSFIVDIGNGLKIPTNPITFDHCYNIGAQAMVDKDYYEALEYFNYAITFKEVNMVKLSQIYCDLGIIYRLAVKDFEKSFDYFELSISADSKNQAAYVNTMSLMNHTDDLKGALEVFKNMLSVINISEIDPRTLHLAGIVCENLRNFEGAKKFYELAIQKGFTEAQSDLNDVLRKINK